MELKEFPSRSRANQRSLRDIEAAKEDDIVIEKLPKIRFGTNVKKLRCPYCQANMTTWIEVRTVIWTHLMAALVCLFCLWPCVPCIYCNNNCLTMKHYCSNCYKYLGESGFLSCLRWRRGDRDV